MTLNLLSPTRLASNLLGTAALLAAGLFTAGGAQAQSVCKSFYPAGFSLVQGQSNPAITSMSKPAKGVAVSEPNFNVCLVRGTNHTTETSTQFLRNDYSRRQAFNASNTYFIAYSNDGWWHLYDANTLQYLRKLSPRVANPSVSSEFHMAGDAEPHWHPTDPNLLYYVTNNGGTKLLRLDVRNNSYVIAADFAGKLPAWGNSAQHIWTKSEGSPSADGRYWGFQVENGSFNLLGYMVWDLEQNKLVGARQDGNRPDHSSMSAGGRWYVTSDDATGTWAWSPDFTQKKKLHAKSEHSDLALGAKGEDIYVSIDYQSPAGNVFMTNIDSCPAVPASASTAPICPRTVLFPTYLNGAATAMHFSGKAFSKPGWILWSTYGTSRSRDGTWPWYRDKIMAVELKASPRMYPIAYHRSNVGDYFAEPHATVSRDFTRIAFNTNWGSSNALDLDMYLINLPATALPGGATPPSQRPTRHGRRLHPVPARPVTRLIAGTDIIASPSTASSSAASPSPSPPSTGGGGMTVGNRVFTIPCVLCRESERVRSGWRTVLSGFAWLRDAWTPAYFWAAADVVLDEPEAPDSSPQPLAAKAVQVGTQVSMQKDDDRH